MKEVEWVGDTRMMPRDGRVETGKTKMLPVDIADSFIKQGLAKEIASPAKKTVKKEK